MENIKKRFREIDSFHFTGLLTSLLSFLTYYDWAILTNDFLNKFNLYFYFYFLSFFRYLHPLLPLTLCRSHHTLPMCPDPVQCLRPFFHYIFMVISLGLHNGRGSFSWFLFWSYTMGETHIKSKHFIFKFQYIFFPVKLTFRWEKLIWKFFFLWMKQVKKYAKSTF